MDGLYWKTLLKKGWFGGTPIFGNTHIRIYHLPSGIETVFFRRSLLLHKRQHNEEMIISISLFYVGTSEIDLICRLRSCPFQ